jgi:hypothetical protein
LENVEVDGQALSNYLHIFNYSLIPLLSVQPSARSEVKLNLKAQTVIMCWMVRPITYFPSSYRQIYIIDGIKTLKEKLKYSETILPRHHFVHHKSHIY